VEVSEIASEDEEEADVEEEVSEALALFSVASARSLLEMSTA
jgi:hypothetical protein